MRALVERALVSLVHICTGAGCGAVCDGGCVVLISKNATASNIRDTQSRINPILTIVSMAPINIKSPAVAKRCVPLFSATVLSARS